MKIFDKRPLSLILCIMLGGFVLFSLGGTIIRFGVFIGAILLLLGFFISVVRKNKKVIMLIASAAVFLSMLLSHLYFDLWFHAEKRFEGEVTVEGTICEITSISSYSVNYIVKTDKINDMPLTSYKLTLSLDPDDAENINVGDVISYKCTLLGFEEDFASYQYSKGISAASKNVSDLKIIESGRFVLEPFLNYVRDFISRHAKMLSDSESGSMLSALLLGERDLLSGQTRLDFKRIGITHLLALSGLHLALLSFGLERLLRALKVRKNFRLILSILFTFLYMCLTGFPTSVMRAGIMLILSSLLFLLSRDNDALTSLFVAVTVICIISPYSVYDLSLCLSAFATLGVIIYSEVEFSTRKDEAEDKKIVKYIKNSLLVSVFAIAATLSITHTSFSEISLVSPIATLIFGFAVEVILYIGTAMLIVGNIIPIGMLLSPVVKLTSSLAAWMSSFDVYVSKNYLIVDILVFLLSIAFFVFIVLGSKKRRTAVTVIITLFISIYLLAGGLHLFTKSDEAVFYSSEEKSDAFVIRSENISCLISSSQYSKSSGYHAIDALEKAKVSYLDKYLATHYSWKLEAEISTLLSNISISEIYLPTPKNEDEKSILTKMSATIKEYRTELKLYENFDTVIVGDYEIRPLYTVPYGEGTSQSVLVFSGEGKTYAYISSGSINSKHQNIAFEAASQATDIIFGAHGKNHKIGDYFEAEYEKVEKIICNSQNLAIPQETARYYIEKGCEIYSHPSWFVLFD